MFRTKRIRKKPDIIVVNGGDNQFVGSGSLTMGTNDIYEVYKSAPTAKIVVTHVEGVNYYTLTRIALKDFLNERNMNGRVLVPNDNEVYTF